MTTAENFYAHIDAILLLLHFTHGASNKTKPWGHAGRVKGTSGTAGTSAVYQSEKPPWIVSATLWTKPMLLNEKLRQVIMNRQVESERKKENCPNYQDNF